MSTQQNIMKMQCETLGLVDSLSYRDKDLLAFLNNICAELIEVLGEGLAAITLYQNNRKHILTVIPGTADPDESMTVEDRHSTYVVSTGQPLTIYDCKKVSQFGKVVEDYRGYLGVPLKNTTGLILGSLCYYVEEARRFTDEEQMTSMGLAERAAIAIDNYRLYQKIAAHNQMLEQAVAERTQALTAAQEKIVQQERLAAIGEFATKITHEIRTPLSTIGLALDYMKTLSLPERAEKRIHLAHSEVNRLERLLSEILLCAKPIALEFIKLELGNYLRAALTSIQHIAKERNQAFIIDAPEQSIWANVDRDKLTQVILNLAKNACEAAPNETNIMWTFGKHQDHVFIKVNNQGEVIPADILPRLTDSFFTTKPNGTGLGMTVIKSIVDAHQGRIDIVSNTASGTSFIIYLPMESW